MSDDELGRKRSRGRELGRKRSRGRLLQSGVGVKTGKVNRTCRAGVLRPRGKQTQAQEQARAQVQARAAGTAAGGGGGGRRSRHGKLVDNYGDVAQNDG
eukprot:scaffold100090_cov66-Phaeocystis_antarctica.AAC.1